MAYMDDQAQQRDDIRAKVLAGMPPIDPRAFAIFADNGPKPVNVTPPDPLRVQPLIGGRSGPPTQQPQQEDKSLAASLGGLGNIGSALQAWLRQRDQWTKDHPQPGSQMKPGDALKARSRAGHTLTAPQPVTPATPATPATPQQPPQPLPPGATRPPASVTGDDPQLAPGRNFAKVNPRFMQAATEYAKLYNAQGGQYRVAFTSGYRAGDPREHGRGNAYDMQLIDRKTGAPLPNYQSRDSAAFHSYQEYANGFHQFLQQTAPDLAEKHRWGGYFSGGPDHYGANDPMHHDIAGDRIGMAGGSWKEGLYPGQAKLFGLTPGGGQGSGTGTGGGGGGGPAVRGGQRMEGNVLPPTIVKQPKPAAAAPAATPEPPPSPEQSRTGQLVPASPQQQATGMLDAKPMTGPPATPLPRPAQPAPAAVPAPAPASAAPVPPPAPPPKPAPPPTPKADPMLAVHRDLDMKLPDAVAKYFPDHKGEADALSSYTVRDAMTSAVPMIRNQARQMIPEVAKKLGVTPKQFEDAITQPPPKPNIKPKATTGMAPDQPTAPPGDSAQPPGATPQPAGTITPAEAKAVVEAVKPEEKPPESPPPPANAAPVIPAEAPPSSQGPAPGAPGPTSSLAPQQTGPVLSNAPMPVQTADMSTPLLQASAQQPFKLWDTPVPWNTLQGWGWGGGDGFSSGGGGGGFDGGFDGGGSSLSLGGFDFVGA